MPSPSHTFQKYKGIFTALSLQGENKNRKCQLRSRMTHNMLRRSSHESLKGLHSLAIRCRFAFLYAYNILLLPGQFYIIHSQRVTVAAPILLWIAVSAQVTIIYPCDACFCCSAPAIIMNNSC